MSETPPAPPSARDDLLTVLALGLLAAAMTTTAHEAVGHGGFCLLHGGRIAQLTSVYFQCRPAMDGVALAGPVGNLVAALLAWTLRRMVPTTHARLRLLLVFVTAFSLFWEAGYVIHAMIHDDGDWVFAARELFGRPEQPWRIGGVVLGVVFYAIGIAAMRRAMRPYGPASARAGALLRWGWLAGAAGAVVASLFYTQDRAAIGQAALEIGAASWPMLLLSFRIPTEPIARAPALTRSWAWIGASALLYAAFIATLGVGLKT
ncbi:MAG TPA: hypothetical protein VG407_12945 [Caulobacteraceae bacterium]|jgi:hypothetical protein|nr:hypothetical protein [Caulobacteraceae bacterium]